MPSSPYAPGFVRRRRRAGTPRLTSAVLWLLALTVAVYFIQETVQQNLPAYLGFHGVRGLIAGELWTPITYAFMHAGLLHLAFNMYALWAFGPRLEAEWGPRAFAGFYLWCAIGGAVAFGLFVHGPPGLPVEQGPGARGARRARCSGCCSPTRSAGPTTRSCSSGSCR
jgi:membrane associated rhomboid family serine protease